MNYEFILNQDQDQADTTLILSFVCYLINNDIIIKGILFIYFFFSKSFDWKSFSNCNQIIYII